MKIIKPGNLDSIYKPITFECKICGCVFEADNTEYQWQFSQCEGYGWYEIKCPTCGVWVTKNDAEVSQE